MISKILRSSIITSLFLFFAALIPRVVDLGRFLTPDEFLWVDRSRNFLAGLINPAYQCDSVVEAWHYVAEGLACTLRTGHPGVTTMWTGSFGFWLSWLPERRTVSLYDYVVNASTNPLDPNLIIPERMGTVFIVSLWVVAIFWLGRRLFGGSIAFVGALLIALSPFHIALSRVIHHDALSTTFMTLSIMTALVFWGQKAGRHWLVASGMFGGLAFMSKSPALVLLRFIAGEGDWLLFSDDKQTGV
ncbi:MAG: glycosyltransferase family 39 protein, partial [Anaerolineae bacterium]|nr:glycosyltransferase family 39 protein [Anaerolineae bacterium]